MEIIHNPCSLKTKPYMSRNPSHQVPGQGGGGVMVWACLQSGSSVTCRRVKVSVRVEMTLKMDICPLMSVDTDVYCKVF